MNQAFFPMPRIHILAAPLLLAAFLLAGCGRDSGLPRDLTSHFKARGISIQPSRAHAPLSERGGYVVVSYDAQVAARIIALWAAHGLAQAGAGRGGGCSSRPRTITGSVSDVARN